jgi:hypothetical protein
VTPAQAAPIQNVDDLKLSEKKALITEDSTFIQN